MIRIENINFRYKGSEKQDLKNISLEIKEGETILLCGASGCGKTTVTRLINGLIPHYYKGELEGNLRVANFDIVNTELYELAGTVGSVFQNPRSQFFSLDTEGEIAFGPENLGLSVAEIVDRKNKIMQEMNLDNLKGRSLFELSGGEKQKIACASVAALKPKIMLLDEPSSNLDWKAIEDLREIILQWKKQGKTIVISEHRLWYLKDLIDRVIYMEDGEIKKEWQEEFSKLNEDELRNMKLRPVNLEPKYISQFTDELDNIDKPVILTNGDKIQLKNFTFRYKRRKEKKVDKSKLDLEIPNLTVKKGSIIGVTGKNGAGKSTFLRCLCGLEKSCKGELKIGENIYRGKELIRKSYMVMQDVNHQLFTDSVVGEVLLSMEKEDISVCHKILDNLGLLEFKDKHPMALSGGQKQRVAIASAMAAEAEILLFDEPTSGLDYLHMCAVSELLQNLVNQGKTLFVSTHDPELIKLCCDFVLQIEDGKVVKYFEV
ncbi:ABC transporter, ATP-binding protein [Gemella bergeri ATCC 700627]|uniref:ABC transporter, ATP-binding protein n=1 Tax=Gemella bergeri ATCC 700627 TaxID=1321820 RepID=U2QMQ8_9BACL|nr:ABC transporter ATP-binding protein [Gemella bergeri]ERK57459.1 ABC transporter, ATP-binding protein [Gemella bergeri ATCC 700627]